MPRESFERGDKRLEVGKGEDGDVLLVLDDVLLPADRVPRPGEFETTRYMRRSGGGRVRQIGSCLCDVLK